MIGAHLLTNDDLHATLQWISDIKLVPLEHAYILRKFRYLKQSTYPTLKQIDLKSLPYKKEDSLHDLFSKYIKSIIPPLLSPENLTKARRASEVLLSLVDAPDIGSFGHYINAISHFHG